ncbi:Ger(x)C family spore germination C-terminal domain-containing protein [Paenibacillus sp. R14(2021)]|uniref:Ger(x)C family spore germination protein n=1 Tax=Paenibacillus sp. R14(2021) TaxID=2859228 RepID=UPI001C6124E6|nr:Ger(x)C family spore germination C-terminal domain-containing protein [Paenibacillus sp. R14(2021)]
MKLGIIIALLLLCTGCWDMKEINQLAIVNLGATDKDPKTKIITAYYQVINPSALSNKQSGAKAAIYTFRFQSNNIGKLSDNARMLMPRLLFMPHMQSLIVSERYARQGIMDLINFYEFSPERRTNVILLVSDSPLSVVMNSFTPLERMPGRFIRSLTDQSGRGFVSGFEPIRMKDMAKRVDHETPIVIPLIHYTSRTSADNTDRLEEANVNKQAIAFIGGAVFLHDVMVGKIDIGTKELYFLLNQQLGNYIETLTVNGQDVALEIRHVKVKRTLNPRTGLHVSVSVQLRVTNNQQAQPLSSVTLHEFETAFNRVFAKRAEALVQLARTKKWDLLGIQDEAGKPDPNWTRTKVTF